MNKDLTEHHSLGLIEVSDSKHITLNECISFHHNHRRYYGKVLGLEEVNNKTIVSFKLINQEEVAEEVKRLNNKFDPVI